MANITIKSVNKRNVTVNVTWDDGLSISDHVVSNVPVESFADAQKYLFDYITGLYGTVKAEADRIAYENPTVDPQVLAAVGHTFDNEGNVIA